MHTHRTNAPHVRNVQRRAAPRSAVQHSYLFLEPDGCLVRVSQLVEQADPAGAQPVLSALTPLSVQRDAPRHEYAEHESAHGKAEGVWHGDVHDDWGDGVEEAVQPGISRVQPFQLARLVTSEW